jgi:hypothetical protein
MHSVLYFSTEYHNSRQNILILFCKYLVDIWEIPFWKYINPKLLQCTTLHPIP